MTQPAPRRRKRDLLLRAFKDDLMETAGNAADLANDAIASAKRKVDAFLGDADTSKPASTVKPESEEVSPEEKKRRGQASEKNKSMLEQLKQRKKETPGMASLSTLLSRMLKPREVSEARGSAKKASQQQDSQARGDTKKASQQPDKAKETATVQETPAKASEARGNAKKASQQPDKGEAGAPVREVAAPVREVVPPVREVVAPVALAAPVREDPGSDLSADSLQGAHFRDTTVGKVFIEVGGYRQSGNVWDQGMKGGTGITVLDVTTPVHVIGLKEDLLLWLDSNKNSYIATKYDGFTPRPGRRYTADEIQQANTKAAREMKIYAGGGKLRAKEISEQARACIPNPTIARYCAELADRLAAVAAAGNADDQPGETVKSDEPLSDEERAKAEEAAAKKAAEAASMQKEIEELEKAGQALVQESGPLYHLAFSVQPVGQAYELLRPDTAAKQQRTLMAAIGVSKLMDRVLGLLD
jgi:hypothetical protein